MATAQIDSDLVILNVATDSIPGKHDYLTITVVSDNPTAADSIKVQDTDSEEVTPPIVTSTDAIFKEILIMGPVTGLNLATNTGDRATVYVRRANPRMNLV